jgi:sugar O-acyltransferase (sialic acid O-acetyltransferase NeuD family)
VKEGLVIIGGGGHAAVVAEAAALRGAGAPILAGYLDDAECPAIAEWAAAMRTQSPVTNEFTRNGGLQSLAGIGPGRGWIIAVGGIELRRNLIAQLSVLQRDKLIGSPSNVVHPRAFISPTAILGAGVFVGPGAIVHPRARVRDHAIINTAAVIEHDCEIGENTHVAPAAALGGGVQIGPDCLIGLGSRVLPTVKIGRGAVVGAGAVVVRDVAPGATVVGVPAAAL